MPLRVRADCSCRRERLPATAVLDSMLDHSRNSLSLRRPARTRPWPPAGLRLEPQGPEEVAAAGALLEVSRLFTAMLRLTRPDIGLRTERITVGGKIAPSHPHYV